MPTSIGKWWRLPQEKTPHRAAPYDELDPPYDIKLVFVQKITFVLRKIKKTDAARAAFFDSNMHRIVCRLGLSRPQWESLQRSPDLLAAVNLLRKEGERRDEKEREGEGKGGVCPLRWEEKRKVGAYGSIRIERSR